MSDHWIGKLSYTELLEHIEESAKHAEKLRQANPDIIIHEGLARGESMTINHAEPSKYQHRRPRHPKQHILTMQAIGLIFVCICLIVAISLFLV